MGDGNDCLPGMRAMEASMPGKSTLTADAADQAALRALSKSEQRGEADRARAILLTLEGRKAEEIAAVLGVHVRGLSQTFPDQCASCAGRRYSLTSGY